MSWYFTITDQMRASGLTGNALLIYAVVSNYSLNGQGCYFGSVDYLAELVGCSRRTATAILRDLVKGGYISVVERPGNTSQYIANPCKNCTPAEIAPLQKLQGRAAKIAGVLDNNNYIYKTCISNARAREGKNVNVPNGEKTSRQQATFVAPGLDEIQAYISENGCRYVDADAFYGYYASCGWKVGNKSMKDWHAAIVGWNARERKRQEQQQAERSERKAAGGMSQASQRYHRMAEMLAQCEAQRKEDKQ